LPLVGTVSQLLLEAPDILARNEPVHTVTPLLEVEQAPPISTTIASVMSTDLQVTRHRKIAIEQVADLPVLEVISATHPIADLTLGLGRVVHDYLALEVTALPSIEGISTKAA
jgi:acetoacetate decarboxylase